MSRLVVVGSPWRVSLRQSQLSDVLQRTRVQRELFDYSNGSQTVSNAIGDGSPHSQIIRFESMPNTIREPPDVSKNEHGRRE